MMESNGFINFLFISSEATRPTGTRQRQDCAPLLLQVLPLALCISCCWA
jgi:hypothetical protein